MEIRWVLDNALNFAPHAAVFALAVAGYAVFGRRWPLAVASLLVVALTGGYIARSDALLTRAHDCDPGPRLIVATFNVQAGAADLDALARYLDDQSVDIVALQEMDISASLQATALHDRFAYGAASLPNWVEIFSNVPLEEIGSFHVPGQSEARRVWRVRLAEPFAADLYFLHGMTPRDAERYAMRTNQFAVIEELLGDTATPAIVVGDMNATVLAPSFAGLLRATDLQTAVNGRRDSATWPSALGILGIRIDHVLQRGFEVCRVERGPSFGSDHRPVIVELGERAAS